MNDIEFKLSGNERINISLERPLDKIHCCEECVIFFQSNDSRMIIYNDSLRNALAVFKEILGDAIADCSKLHPSIAKDIGYLWNEELNETPGLVYKDSGFWVGSDHLVWTNVGEDRSRTVTWLYNNDKGDIILEITPTYKWHFSDPEPGEDFISYQDFMKNYKPILFRTIPKAVAQEWLKKAQALLQQIELNQKQ